MVVYRNSNASVATALRRLTRTRHNDLTREQQYRDDQLQFVLSVRHILRALRSQYQSYLVESGKQLLGEQAEIHQHVDDPHPKRALRVHCYKQIRDNGTFADHLWLHTILYKLKKAEYAKPNKVPRMIGDLDTPASLQGFRGFDAFKKCQTACDYVSQQSVAHFCAKPTQKELREVFRQLISPEKKYYFVYFSDDSSLSVRLPDGTVRSYNMDIKKCDSSHAPGVFQALEMLTPENLATHIATATAQLLKPLSIYSNVTHSRERVLLLPDSHVLASGWTGTTVINNVANLLIFLAIERSGATTEEEIILAAAQAGYIVELEPCETYSDLQFLKHSPIYDTQGRLQPFLNLGVLLRTYGACKGDLPGTKRDTLATRATAFNLAVINGMYPRTRCRLIDTLLSANVRTLGVCRPELRRKAEEKVGRALAFKVEHHDDDEPFVVSSEEVCKRYRIEAPYYEYFLDQCRHLTYCHHLSSQVGEKILRKDYGLSVAVTVT